MLRACLHDRRKEEGTQTHEGNAPNLRLSTLDKAGTRFIWSTFTADREENKNEWNDIVILYVVGVSTHTASLYISNPARH